MVPSGTSNKIGTIQKYTGYADLIENSLVNWQPYYAIKHVVLVHY